MADETNDLGAVSAAAVEGAGSIAPEAASHVAKRHYWLSFCDGDLPKGHQFLGVVLIDHADSLEDAVRQACRSGSNPGGEVAAMDWGPSEAPEDAQRAFDVAPKLQLLSMKDLSALGLNPTRQDGTLPEEAEGRS